MVIVRITGKPEIIQQEKPGGKTGLDSLLQRDRALLRVSATQNPTYGVLCERRKCGPHHLLHLPEIQSGMENPHPQPIYTSCLTSPGTLVVLRTDSIRSRLFPHFVWGNHDTLVLGGACV